MPRKNSRKIYVENGYYHLYNRGVEKRKIFLDEEDLKVFLSYLKTYLSPKNETELRNKLADPSLGYKERRKILREIALNNFYGKMELLVFALMPNHFHLIIKQKNPEIIDQFMNSLCTRYTLYFNQKHKRTGHLFEGTYKGVLVESDAQLLQLSRYIHKQSLSIDISKKWIVLFPSSFNDFLGNWKTDWICSGEILSFFSKNNPHLSYENFVLGGGDEEIIAKLVIEEN